MHSSVQESHTFILLFLLIIYNLLTAHGFCKLMCIILRLSHLGSLSYFLIVTFYGDRLDLLTISQLGNALYNHTVADMKTRSYDIVLAVILWINLDLRVLHLVVLAYYINEVLVLYFNYSVLRNYNC